MDDNKDYPLVRIEREWLEHITELYASDMMKYVEFYTKVLRLAAGKEDIRTFPGFDDDELEHYWSHTRIAPATQKNNHVQPGLISWKKRRNH